MSTTQDESALQELAIRVAKVEQANADLQEKLATLQAGQLPSPQQITPFNPVPPPPGNFGSATLGIPAVSAIGIQGADGVDASSDSGTAVSAQSSSGSGMHAVGGGASPGMFPFSFPAAAIFAEGGPNPGVVGTSKGSTFTGGFGPSAGVVGIDIGGSSSPFPGTGVVGRSLSNGTGVEGRCDGGVGILGDSISGIGVAARSDSSDGVQTLGAYGVYSIGSDIGVYAQNLSAGNAAYLGTRGLAGDFYGEVFFHNTIHKQGGGFQIDHPLDPAKKYLSHSFVESPDMKNIYDGIAVLNAQGEAEVELPDWFEALNTDFRYQLTCIGSYTPVYIAQEIHDHRFTIAGGKAGMKISWQVTGTRQDAWANAHRVQVEIDKPIEEQGYYLAPELHGESAQKSIRWARYSRQKEPRWPRMRAGERV